MSVFKNEPKVFSDAYKLALEVFQTTKSYPKPFRPSLGRRLEENALELTKNIRVALFSSVKSSSPKGTAERHARNDSLKYASDSLDEIRVVLKFSFDLRLIPLGKYKEFSQLTQELGKELGGLLKASAKGVASESSQ